MEYRRRTGGRDQNGEGASLRRIPIESKPHSSVKKDPKKRRRQGTSGGVVCAEEGDSARKPQKRRNTAAAVFRCAALPVLFAAKRDQGACARGGGKSNGHGKASDVCGVTGRNGGSQVSVETEKLAS